MMSYIKKIVKFFVMILYRIEILIFPVNPKIVVFESNMGRNYTGNPRCIYEEMARRGLDQKYRCYVILEDPATEVPGHAVKVKRTRFQYFYIMARAGVIVSDSRMPKFIVKRKGVTYI